MVRKVTEELRNKLISARKSGMTYDEIIRKFGVSKWTCINYLRDVKIEKSYIEKAWRQAEEDVVGVLVEKGFTNLLNLNDICSCPYWDYYAEKDNKRWLIDVTINGKKSVIDKYSRILDGYSCCILHKKDDGSWHLIKLEVKEL